MKDHSHGGTLMTNHHPTARAGVAEAETLQISQVEPFTVRDEGPGLIQPVDAG